MLKKKRKICFSAAASVLLVSLLCAGFTHSYFTDWEEEENITYVGYQESSIEEDFPTPTEIPVKENPEYKKVVQILNHSEAQNADCFVRARILFSNSEIGEAAILNGMDRRWQLSSDGYYYYTELVKAGNRTAPLLTSVKIDGSRVPSGAKAYIRDFRISIYEESVGAREGQQMEDVWNTALHPESREVGS